MFIWHPAERKGYAGTAVWSRTPLREEERGVGGADSEGRILRVSTRGISIRRCVPAFGVIGR